MAKTGSDIWGAKRGFSNYSIYRQRGSRRLPTRRASASQIPATPDCGGRARRVRGAVAWRRAAARVVRRSPRRWRAPSRGRADGTRRAQRRRARGSPVHTHTHTHAHIYIYYRQQIWIMLRVLLGVLLVVLIAEDGVVITVR